MKRYAIWNKQDPIITPIGEVLSAEQWIQRYPVAAIPTIDIVCAAGEINGAFFGTLSQLVDTYTREGCDFSNCTTAEEKMSAIENFDNEKAAKQAAREEEAKAKAEEEAANAELNAASLASIAASMEYQNMMTLPDEEV